MQTATFYSKTARSRAATQTKAALTEVRQAAESLRAVLHPGTSSIAQQQSVLEDATDRLLALQHRIARHRELIGVVTKCEQRIAAKDVGGKGKLDRVERAIVNSNVERVNFLASKDEIRHDLLLAKRRLEKENEEIEALGADVATDEDSEDDCGRPTENVRIAHLASGDWDDSLELEEEVGL